MSHNLFRVGERERLTWMNEPTSWEYTADDGLCVHAPAKADFFKDPAGKHMVHSAPFLHVPAETSFQLTTQLLVEMHHIYDSGCLMLMADEDNWAKLCYEFNGEHATIVSVVTQNGCSDDCNSERVTVENPFLRITKRENTVSFFYSANGEHWKLIRYFGMKAPGGFKAGVVAQSPMGTGCRACFKYLSMTKPDTDSRF